VSTTLFDSLVGIVGKENVSSKEMDLICYSSDVAPLPDTIISTYGMKMPSLIVRPQDPDQISAILKLANEKGVPVTPRAGASSGMGAGLPIDGGIVLDMTSMDSILLIDEERMRVTVQAGVTFQKLLSELGKRKLKLGTCPTSAPSSTVGGYISNGGCAGIGAPKYGPIGSQILELDLVLPNGEILSVDTPYSSLFVGAEGTLGVITQVVLRIQPIPESFTALAYGFDDIVSACHGLESLLGSGVMPNSLTFVDRHFLDTVCELGLDEPKHEIVIFLTLEGRKQEVVADEKAIDKIFFGGKRLNSSFAMEEWERRYKAELFIKRAGPTIILGETNIPIIKLKEAVDYLKEVNKKLGLNTCFYGIMGYGGSMLTMPIVLTDERLEEDYFNTLLASLKMTSAVISKGGVVYTVGLHNCIFMEFIHNAKKLEIMKSLKKNFDPNGILNPGKLTECRTAWLASLIK
jgi:FAD/FMN-containing dehydrogenase